MFTRYAMTYLTAQGDPTVYRLTNPTMNYTWGSVDLIPQLMGRAPDGRPVAEMWMGAHAAAPSSIVVDGGDVGLDDFIAACPARALGAQTVTDLGVHLPFMMKLLAAAEPLSLQVHPTRAQAHEGFQRENAAGIALTDPTRNYRDDGHKPEMLYALTEFEMLCGFRPADAIRELLVGLKVEELNPLIGALKSRDPAEAIETALSTLLTAEPQYRADLADMVVQSARVRREHRPEYRLVGELAALYPGDIGVVASLFLNHLRIGPGESVFVRAGTIHSYLRGLGVELMATSDNVLRAGLTSKHIDTQELLHLVDFVPREPPRLHPAERGDAIVFVPPVPDFALWIYTRDKAAGPEHGSRVEAPVAGARIAVCCNGQATLMRHNEQVNLQAGQAAFIPHSDGPVGIVTTGTVAVACTA